METAQQTELEDLEQLIASDGWKTFSETVAKLWGTSEGGGSRFMEAVSQASKGSDADALAHLRQIIVAQREIHAAMNFPITRIKALKQAQPQSGPLPFNGSRRGGL